MTQQQYEKLRQVIIEANPEEIDSRYVCQCWSCEGKYPGKDRENCRYGITGCDLCITGSNVELRLGDILLALDIKPAYQSSQLFIAPDGLLSKLDEDGYHETLQLPPYNLKQDNLDDQSDELKQFLYKLLVEGGV